MLRRKNLAEIYFRLIEIYKLSNVAALNKCLLHYSYKPRQQIKEYNTYI